jgi:hypothetical protein
MNSLPRELYYMFRLGHLNGGDLSEGRRLWNEMTDTEKKEWATWLETNPARPLLCSRAAILASTK